MILRALYDLAQREQLVPDPDFPLVPVSWLVTVGADGVVHGITDNRSSLQRGSKRAPRMVANSLPVPRQPGRTSADLAFFLCDKAEYVFGRVLGEAAAQPRVLERARVRAALFRDGVRACVEATDDAGAAAVLSALDAVANGEQSVELPPDCASNDLFTFLYEPDIDLPVHMRPAVQHYWRGVRQVAGCVETPRFSCIITGVPFGEPANFPKVKHVPGGQTSGVPLVSFNAPAFESYGLARNENAPISRGAAEAAATALQRLLDPAFPDPRPAHRGERLPPRHVRIGDDTAVCYWSADAAADPFLDALGPLLDETEPAAVGELFRSIWRGRPAPVDVTAPMYGLVLSGAQGRMIVRDWFETSIARANENLARYFADLSVVANAPAARGRERAQHLPLNVLLASLAPFGKRDGIPPSLAAQLVSAALRGTRIPVAVLQRAIERARAEIGRSEWSDLERGDARAALVKAALIRTYNHQLNPAMDIDNSSPGYQCGRLMAILERLQQLALGDINAGVVDRYFSSASATPRAVFVRLLRGAQHHARKVQDDPQRAGTAVWLKRQIDEISTHFDARRNGFPAFLDLEQQGLFLLGYHQQRHALWSRRTDAPVEEPQTV